MSSLQQLQSERGVFIATYLAHKITKEELDSALAVNTQQQNALKASTPAQPVQTSTPAYTPTGMGMVKSEAIGNTTQPVATPTPAPVTSTPSFTGTGYGLIPSGIVEAGQKDPTMQDIVIPSLMVVPVVAGAIVVPEIVIPAVAIGLTADVGIKSAVKSYETGEAQLVLPSTYREVAETSLISAGFGLIGGGVIGGVAKAAPSLAGQVANPVVRAATRIGINTGLGAAGGAVLGGGDPDAIWQGAAFGAAFGLAGEAVGAVGAKIKTPKAISNIQDNILGSKFKEITGATEIYEQTTVGKQTFVTRVTEPTVETVRLKGADAKFYRENNMGTLKDPTIELAGKQRTKTFTDEFGLQEVTRYDVPVESTRNAQPIISALKGEELTYGKIRVGDVNRMLNTKSDYSAIEKVQVRAGTGQVNVNGVKFRVDRPVTLLEKTVTTNENALLPKALVSVRTYTGVKVRGVADPQIYAGAAKALPDDMAQAIYKKLGGGYKQGSSYFDESTKLKGMKPFGGSKGDKAPGVAIEEQFKLEQAKVKEGISLRDYKDMTANSKAMKKGSNKFFEKTSGKDNTVVKQIGRVNEVKEVTLPRAIVGEIKGVSKIRFTGYPSYARISQAQVQDEDTVSLSYPNVLRTPSIISKPNIAQTNYLSPQQYSSNRLKTSLGTSPINIFRTSTVQTSKTKLFDTPLITPIKATKTTPNQIIKTTPDQIIKQTPTTITKTTPITIPKNPTKQTYKYNPQINTKTAFNPKTLGFSFGGGYDGPKGKSNKGSNWFQKKHQLKTFSQMLNTFGVGAAAKPMKGIDKATKNFTKAFKPKQNSNSNRRKSRR